MMDIAQSYTVRYFIGKLWEFIPRFYMMGMKFFNSFTVFKLASIIVSLKNCLSPLLVLAISMLPSSRMIFINSRRKITTSFATILCRFPISLQKRIAATLANKNRREIKNLRAFFRASYSCISETSNKIFFADWTFTCFTLGAVNTFWACYSEIITTYLAGSEYFILWLLSGICYNRPVGMFSAKFISFSDQFRTARMRTNFHFWTHKFLYKKGRPPQVGGIVVEAIPVNLWRPQMKNPPCG
jgi:hypothetical protein